MSTERTDAARAFPMEYFTAEEARRIITHGNAFLCSCGDGNPNKEAMRELLNITTDYHSPAYAAAFGFLLGRATGKREERRRQQRTRCRYHLKT